MKNKNRILTSVFVILAHLNTAHAWKVDKDGTTQMKLTDDGKLWVGEIGPNGTPKFSSVVSANATEDRAVTARTVRTTGTNYGIVATAAGSGATMNVGLYGYASGATNNYGLLVESGYGIFDDRVGIGTQNPSSTLHLEGATGAELRLRATNAQQANTGAIIFQEAEQANNIDGNFAILYNGAKNQLEFNTWDINYAMVIERSNGYVGLGTESPQGKLDVHGDIYYHNTRVHSDRRWKKDIVPLKNSLSKINSLKGVSYKWDLEKYPNMSFSDKTQIGFIAQEVEPIIPELVSTNSNGYKSINYEKMVAVLTEAVKELKQQNDALKELVCQDKPDANICVE